jgi:nucleoid-associated protein
MDSIFLAARSICPHEKQPSLEKQYVSFLKAKKGPRVTEYFRDFIGCQEGIDGPGETRTLLKAFSDVIESEDLGEDAVREKIETLVSYTMAQSEVLDDDQPKAFAKFIRAKDYGLLAPTGQRRP